MKTYEVEMSYCFCAMFLCYDQSWLTIEVDSLSYCQRTILLCPIYIHHERYSHWYNFTAQKAFLSCSALSCITTTYSKLAWWTGIYTDLELLNLVIDYENDLNVHGDCDLSCIATRHERERISCQIKRYCRLKYTIQGRPNN